MKAVAFRVRSLIRRRWPSAIGAFLLTAIVSGAVLMLVAGARRTATAPDRLTTALGRDPDAIVQQEYGRPRRAEIAALPSVRSFDTVTFIGLQILDPAHEDGGGDVNTFAGTGLVGRLVEGREADPFRSDEFTANLSFARSHDAHVGDRFQIVTLTQDQFDSGDFGGEPLGPSFEAELVGITDSPDDLDDPTPTVVFSPALLDDDRIGVVSTLWALYLNDGSTVADLRAQLDSLPGGTELGLGPARLVSETVRNSVDAQAKGLWAISLVAGLAAIVAIGQLLTRQVRLAEADRRLLVALGLTHRQLDGESLGRAAVPVVSGVALGAVLAGALSGVFPTGFVRRLETHRGFRPDLLVLGVGGLALVALLLGWVAAALVLGRGSHPVMRNSRAVDALAAAVPTPSASTGVRFGLGRHERDTVSFLGTSAGLILAVTGVVGAAVFTVSLRHLVHDGDRFGNNFDYVIGNGWLPPPTDLPTALTANPDVQGLMFLGTGSARAGDVSVELVGVESARGGLQPVALEGRLPVSGDEIALGRLTARELGVQVGSEVVLDGDGGSSPFRVVGLAVVPSLGINEGVGNGAIVDLEGLQTLVPDSIVKAAAVVLTPAARADLDAARQRLGSVTGSDPSTGFLPASMQNVGRVENIPIVLAALLVILGLVTIVQTLVASVRARRHDLAVLRSMGADRRFVGRVIRWQSTAVAAVPILVGIPLGLVVGRLVFRAFVERIGAVPDPSTPLIFTVAAAVALVVVANVAGMAAAHRSLRQPAAIALRSE